MRKWLSYMSIGIFGLVATAVVTLVAFNLWDPPLNAEVEKILQAEAPPNETQRKAYEYLLGTYTGDIENAETRGAELYRDLIKGGELWPEVSQKRWWSIESLPCDFCDSESLQDELIRKRFEEAQDRVQAYTKLMSFRDIKSFKGTETKILFGPPAFPFNVHKYFLLQLSIWLDKKGDERVLDLLQSSNQFMFNVLQNGSLLERMQAAFTLVRNAKFLARERERRPKLVIPRDLIESFRMPETNDIMFGAMEEEVRIFARVTRSMRVMNDLTLSSLAEGLFNPIGTVLSWLPVRMAFKPHDTINRFHHIAGQLASTDCPEGMEIETCIPDLKWARFNSPLDYVVNPLGRSLIFIVAPHSNRRTQLQKRRQEMTALRESFHL